MLKVDADTAASNKKKLHLHSLELPSLVRRSSEYTGGSVSISLLGNRNASKLAQRRHQEKCMEITIDGSSSNITEGRMER